MFVVKFHAHAAREHATQLAQSEKLIDRDNTKTIIPPIEA